MGVPSLLASRNCIYIKDSGRRRQGGLILGAPNVQTVQSVLDDASSKDQLKTMPVQSASGWRQFKSSTVQRFQSRHDHEGENARGSGKTKVKSRKAKNVNIGKDRQEHTVIIVCTRQGKRQARGGRPEWG